ncbi:twin-arginine translocation system, TatB protein [Paucimonas lemoignei]|jgi:sec-independent protein translocase protein TatB|nr:twin-arginine translocation system, TatB protein [Paucimonas lemoignei]
MFGISFSELLLVGLVALLVLGPERLPGAARTAGLWVGRLKRSFNAIKQEVEREIGADEIRRQLHNEHILSLEQEARKILSPQQPPAPTPPAVEPTPPAPVVADEPVVTSVPPTPSAPVADLGPAAPAGTTPVAADPASHAEPPHAAPQPNAPSANDSSLPPRAP